jgi:hypothetical protein
MDQLIEIVIHNSDDTISIKKEKDDIMKKVKEWLKKQNYDLKLTDYEFNLWFNNVILPRYTQDLKYFEK